MIFAKKIGRWVQKLTSKCRWMQMSKREQGDLVTCMWKSTGFFSLTFFNKWNQDFRTFLSVRLTEQSVIDLGYFILVLLVPSAFFLIGKFPVTMNSTSALSSQIFPGILPTFCKHLSIAVSKLNALINFCRFCEF